MHNGSSVWFSKEASGKNKLQIVLDVKPKELRINILGTEKSPLRGARAETVHLYPS